MPLNRFVARCFRCDVPVPIGAGCYERISGVYRVQHHECHQIWRDAGRHPSVPEARAARMQWLRTRRPPRAI